MLAEMVKKEKRREKRREGKKEKKEGRKSKDDIQIILSFVEKGEKTGVLHFTNKNLTK